MREQLSLDAMKSIELDIMDEIDTICRKNHIPYFLMYGTLIGAYRHGGFIPWDDDIDICMFRSDYERFIELFAENRSTVRFDLVFYRNGKAFFPFAKVVDTTTVVYENFVRKDVGTGVWVDIFILDDIDPAIQNLKALYRKRNRANLLYSFTVADPNVGSSAMVKLAKRIICPIVRNHDPKKSARIIDETASQLCSGESAFVTDFVGEGIPEHVFSRNLFEPEEVIFENRRYLAPKGYEEILTAIYGDWRTPPAEDNRPIHTCEAYKL